MNALFPGLMLSTIALACLAASEPPREGGKYLAADGVLVGQARVASEMPDGSGRVFVTGFVQPADAVDIVVQAPAAGYYFLELGYACDSAKRIPVFVNGRAQGSRLFPKTLGFAEHRYGRILLAAGANTIRIGTDWGYADLDFIRLVPADAPGPFHLSTMPVNPRASPAARRLYTELTGRFGRATFAGQHDSAPLEDARLKQIARLTQDAAPALLGLDLIYYSQAWNRPDGDGAIERALDWARNRHGIVTLSWHWLAPAGFSERIWDSFSTDKTSFDLDRLADETSPEYQAVVGDLDRIAEKLKVLRDAGIPVLWRPLHEAEGRWFWWGSRGPEPAKYLYRLMFDRFTRLHHLDNLLWVWTSSDDPGARDWYPGDDLVDIVATDLYFPAGTRGDFFAVFDGLRELYGGRKPIALGECGVMPTPGPEAPWLWFLVWDDFIARPDMNSAAVIAQTYADPRIITHDRLRALRIQSADQTSPATSAAPSSEY